jgi:ubiquinone/menaquinone biosynthesis C-methylase UbiE
MKTAIDLSILRCPQTGQQLEQKGDLLQTKDGTPSYRITKSKIPLFAESFCSDEGRTQQRHYDKFADDYLINLSYPHTQEYNAYLDQVLQDAVGNKPLGHVAEICCGRGEALHIFADQINDAVGLDISLSMLEVARQNNPNPKFSFIQGDATRLPIKDGCIDTVFMLGGIHHVPDRKKLFREIARILKPEGRLIFREPVNDFFLWQSIRSLIYRLSPALDHETEEPLTKDDTQSQLATAGLKCTQWKTYGFLGFCLLMNSDILVFNRAFRYLPGIRALTRLACRLDDRTIQLPGLQNAGLQVIGVAQKI